MNDDFEAILKATDARGAGPTLRTRVLDAVAEHLPKRAGDVRPTRGRLPISFGSLAGGGCGGVECCSPWG